MTIQEFNERIEGTVNEKDYKIIEYVYNWHPSISDTKGKDEIAELYSKFGMRIIKDMVNTAEENESFFNEIQNINHEIEKLMQKKENILAMMKEK